MGYLYDTLEKVKKSIILMFNNKKSEYLQYLEITDHAQEDLHSPRMLLLVILIHSYITLPAFPKTVLFKKVGLIA